MTDSTDLAIINKLTEVLGQSSGETIAVYTHYYTVTPWVWVGFGFFLFIISLIATLLAEEGKVFILAIGMFISGLFVACNLSDILSPKAVAIHQLIKDVRG